MNGRPRPWQTARAAAALDAGHVVVCWRDCAGGIAGARQAARELSERLVADFAAHCGNRGQTLRISRTAADGIAGAAGAVGTPIGLDVEAPGPSLGAAAMALALHPADGGPADPQEFRWLWTRKEAVLKALGLGLALDPRRIRTGFRDDDWRAVPIPWGGTLRVRSLAAPAGQPAALAVLGAGRPVTVFGWPDASPAIAGPGRHRP